jgi:hypothetical protein
MDFVTFLDNNSSVVFALAGAFAMREISLSDTNIQDQRRKPSFFPLNF